MIRLTLLTLAALFLILTIYGKPDTNAPARTVVKPRAATAPAVQADPVSQPEPQVIQAVSQTDQQAPRFPGPALRPSPEHATAAEAAVTGTSPSATDDAIMYVTGNRVNFRAGPSTGDRVIGALLRGSPVEMLGETGGWANIRDTQGRVGYMSARFLSSEAPN